MQIGKGEDMTQEKSRIEVCAEEINSRHKNLKTSKVSFLEPCCQMEDIKRRTMGYKKDALFLDPVNRRSTPVIRV